jgi:hypothetical protein
MKRVWKIVVGIAVAVALLIVAGIVALNAIDPNQYRGMIADAVTKETGRRLVVDGDLTLKVGFPAAISVGNVRFANADWGSQPEMINARHVAVQVRPLPLILGELRILRVVVEGVDVLLETDADGRGNWEFGEPPKEIVPAAAEPKSTSPPALPSVREVKIREVTVTYRDRRTGTTLHLALDGLTLAADSFESPLQLALDAKVNDARLTAKGTVGSVATLVAGDRPFPLALEFEAVGVQGSVAGSVARPLETKGIDLQVAAESQDLARAAAAIGLSLPTLPPLRVEGKLTDGDNSYTLDNLTASAGRSDLSGSVRVALGGIRPKITATLSSQVADVGEIAGIKAAGETPKGGNEAATGKAPAAGAAAPARVIPDDPLPLEALSAVDADISLQIAKLLLVAGVDVEQVSVQANLADGRLSAHPRIERIAGGSLGGSVQVAKDGAVDAEITAVKVATGQLLKALAVTDMLDGAPLDANITAAGGGTSLRSIAAGLDADVRIILGEGRISNQALGLAAGDVLSQLVGAVDPFAKTEKATTLKCGVIRAPIRKGRVTFDNSIGIETDKMDVLATGTVDLRSEAIDLGARAVPREGLGISVAAVASSFVRIGGTLAEPSVGIDPLGSAEGVAKLGATVGAAIATGGLSLLAGALLGTDGPACQVALGPEAKAGKPGEAAAPKQKQGRGPLESIGKEIKGLFGN